MLGQMIRWVDDIKHAVMKSSQVAALWYLCWSMTAPYGTNFVEIVLFHKLSRRVLKNCILANRQLIRHHVMVIQRSLATSEVTFVAVSRFWCSWRLSTLWLILESPTLLSHYFKPFKTNIQGESFIYETVDFIFVSVNVFLKQKLVFALYSATSRHNTTTSTLMVSPHTWHLNMQLNAYTIYSQI